MNHPRKYRNKPTVVDGIRFDSKKEATRYGELRLLERAGQIRDLRLQPRFKIEVNGIKICEYRADFIYTDAETGERIIEDVKGMKTQVYRLKKKLVEVVHGVDITEV